MYSFGLFRKLPKELQIDLLNTEGVVFDLAYSTRNTEAVLFGYHNFYVELVVEKYTDEILSVKCFKSMKRLEPYLPQVDISEIITLLAY